MWFDPAQLMQNTDAHTATLATSATFTLTPTVNDGKVARIAKVATPEILKLTESGSIVGACDMPKRTLADARMDTVIDRLHVQPELRYAMETHIEAEPEAAILTLAIRGKGACELRIPKSRYDAFALLELIEKRTARETLQ